MKRDFVLNRLKSSIQTYIDLAIFDLRCHYNEVFKFDLSFGTPTKDCVFLHVSLWKEPYSYNILQNEIEKFVHYLSVYSYSYSVDWSVDWNPIKERVELNFVITIRLFGCEN